MINKQRLLLVAGNLGTSLIIIGALFKISHYPLQNEILAVGSAIFAIFLISVLAEIFSMKRSIVYKIAWSVVIVLIPIIGSWIYYHKELKLTSVCKKTLQN